MSVVGAMARSAKVMLGLTEKITIDEDDADFIAEVRKMHSLASEAEGPQRTKEKDDLRFCDPENHWPANIKAERLANDQPCLTEDQLGPFIDLVVNQQRQNRPTVRINPVGDGADQETAEIFEGLIRHIQSASNGDTARDTAYESMVRCGRGFYRILTDYESPESFNQIIKFQRIPNHFMVYLDPESQEPDGSDAQWCLLEEDFSKERFEQEFPDAKMSSVNQDAWESIGDHCPGWIGKDGESCRVVEVYKKEYKDKTLCGTSDGKAIWADKLPAGVAPKVGSKVSDLVKITQVRQSRAVKVTWTKMNAVEVLDRKEWPGSWIPVLPVYGKELNVDGDRSWAGIVRSAKDPQMRLDWMITAETEIIGLVSKSPWIGPLGFMGNRKEMWQTSNRRNYAALEYDIVSQVDGKPLPPPQRNIGEPPIQAVSLALQGAQMGLKSTTGMYNPSQGNAEHDLSGIATKTLVNQGDLTNFHFSDNLARTIHHEGVILVELIPLIYDTERTEQILREDGNHEVVTLKPAEGDDDPMTSTSGDIKKAFDLSSGRYGVTISAGANYTTRRQENFQAFTSLLKGMPALGNLAPDLIISQMDIPIAKEISDRMVLGLPPAVQQAIQAKKQGKPMDPQTMQLMAHAQQQQMLIQQLTQGLSVMQQKVASKEMETQAKIQTALIQARAAIIAARERAEADRQDNVMTAYFEQALTHIDRQYDLLENSQQAALAPPQGAAGPTGAPSPAGQPASPQTAGASSPGGM